jgi:hypothetical protein
LDALGHAVKFRPSAIQTIKTMTESNKSGDLRISPKWLPPEVHKYLKEAAKRERLTETAIIVEALKLHEEKYLIEWSNG